MHAEVVDAKRLKFSVFYMQCGAANQELPERVSWTPTHAKHRVVLARAWVTDA